MISTCYDLRGRATEFDCRRRHLALLVANICSRTGYPLSSLAELVLPPTSHRLILQYCTIMISSCRKLDRRATQVDGWGGHLAGFVTHIIRISKPQLSNAVAAPASHVSIFLKDAGVLGAEGQAEGILDSGDIRGIGAVLVPLVAGPELAKSSVPPASNRTACHDGAGMKASCGDVLR